MKGYKISHEEKFVSNKPLFIEQCIYHGNKTICFFGWVIYPDIVSETVAIFKIKWKP